MEFVITHDWHEAWNKVCLDTDGLAVSDPVKVHLIVIEQLRDDNICSRINLLLEMHDVVISA